MGLKTAGIVANEPRTMPPGKKILIVDDEPDIVELVSMMLDDGHLLLLAAYDGEEALKVVRKHRVDLVLTDVMMPYLDGRALCRTIKSEPSTEDIAVILMGAAGGFDPVECGADGFISKPFDPLALIVTVHRVLQAGGDRL